MDARLVIATFPEGEGIEIVRTLVEEKWIACGNLLPGARSVYRWEGRIEDAAETVALLKTWADRVEGLKRRLAELHPYDVPEILVLAVGGGLESYVDWLREETR